MACQKRHLLGLPGRVAWLLTLLFFTPTDALADRTARYDPICSHMAQALTQIPQEGGLEKSYFLASIPRQLLLVNLHPLSAAREYWLATWRRYGAEVGYQIEEVGPALSQSLRSKLPPGHFRLARTELAAGNIIVAEKIVRLGLMAEQGGISVDVSIFPPRQQEAYVSFSKVMPMRGLVILASEKPQNTRRGVSGLTADDAFVASSPHHPVLQAMVENLSSNIASLRIDNLSPASSYLAGHVFLTRALSGSFTALPRAYAASLDFFRHNS